MQKKINNVIRIPTSLQDKFFKYWLEFLSPFHHLTSREIEVAATFIKHRYELSKAIKDNNIINVDQMLMSEESKRKIREECGISAAHFQVIMGKLRKNNIIVNGNLNPKFIPNIEDSTGVFQLLLLFDLQ